MTTQAWEQSLLRRAWDAAASLPRPVSHADDALLQRAYHHCERMTAAYSRTFYLASGFLPPRKRRAVRALYAFCRVTDNLVDESEGLTARAALESWRGVLTAPHPTGDEPQGLVALAWGDTQAHFHIPTGYALQLIEGVARDLTQTRYTTFADLADYAYGVASTVGLMAMHIIGFAGEATIPYAVKLGVALQLTNILRDVGEDWGRGRLYLPKDDLARFGISEGEIALSSQTGRVTLAWRSFMTYQIARTRQLYAEAQAGIAFLNREGRFAIGAAAHLYRGILDVIERNGCNVFTERARLSLSEKMRRIPAIWWRMRRLQAPHLP
ncbi:MAG TPA: squalene/phytoene synthase family protein [Aggregatilineales bacterium]|nr:squalene/phytoene synthase family protein [Anaerolineales bacterium]HRE47138.1 squalene/phytoene synthase family protein [Aggregatilineales bacterium]